MQLSDHSRQVSLCGRRWLIENQLRESKYRGSMPLECSATNGLSSASPHLPKIRGNHESGSRQIVRARGQRGPERSSTFCTWADSGTQPVSTLASMVEGLMCLNRYPRGCVDSWRFPLRKSVLFKWCVGLLVSSLLSWGWIQQGIDSSNEGQCLFVCFFLLLKRNKAGGFIVWGWILEEVGVECGVNIIRTHYIKSSNN